jgi:hypothetical protein
MPLAKRRSSLLEVQKELVKRGLAVRLLLGLGLLQRNDLRLVELLEPVEAVGL